MLVLTVFSGMDSEAMTKKTKNINMMRMIMVTSK